MSLDIQTARKRPIEIAVVELTEDNVPDAAAWCGGVIVDFAGEERIEIPTLEGDVYAVVGDFIARGVEGEFYPIKASIFEATYDIIEGPADAGG